MISAGISAAAIHGNKTQGARTKAPIGLNGRLVFAIQCEHCKEHFREKDVQVNHKNNCIKNGISWEEIEGIIRRMFDVQPTDLEHLCKDCHDLVTYTERYLKALTPFIFKLVDDIVDAKKKNSDGGKKITKSERQEIIMEHVIDFPQIIEL